MEKKSTRIVYIDNTNISVYENLPAEEFKEFFMGYFKYTTGEDITKYSDNPMIKALLLSFKNKIDIAEEKWERRRAANAANGAKGGRPQKKELSCYTENKIEPSTEFEDTFEPEPECGNKVIIPTNATIVEKEPVLEPQTEKEYNVSTEAYNPSTEAKNPFELYIEKYPQKATQMKQSFDMFKWNNGPTVEKLESETGYTETQLEEAFNQYKQSYKR